MVTTPAEISVGQKNFANQKFYRKDFTGMELRHANFKGASCVECNFTDVDARYANFEGANCWGANFTRTILARANMANCCLEQAIWSPKDVYGLTITLQCSSFYKMKPDPFWIWVWLFMPLLMDLPASLETKLIEFITPQRYLKFKDVFSRRII